MSNRLCNMCCSNDSSADYICLKCGETAVWYGGDNYYYNDENELYEQISGDYETQIKCSCGHDKFDASYYEYCSLCESRLDKD